MGIWYGMVWYGMVWYGMGWGGGDGDVVFVPSWVDISTSTHYRY